MSLPRSTPSHTSVRPPVRGARARLVGALSLVALAACWTPTLARQGRNAPPPSPSEPWRPTASAVAPLTPAESSLAHLGEPGWATRPVLAQADMTLPDVLNAALERNPQTRISWAQARAAAASVGAARGAYLPSLGAGVTGGPTTTATGNTRVPNSRSTFQPTLSLSYLLFDFGGRAGNVESARQALASADLTHNATLQNVVLQTEIAYFDYQANRQLRQAQQASVQTAEANLAAAQGRHDVGLATIADVLQARPALAQERLALQTYEGDVQSSRAALAAAMGVSPAAPFEVVNDSSTPRIAEVTVAVDSLIAEATRARPDLAALRADARSAQADVRVARAAGLPSLTVGSSLGRTFSTAPALRGNTTGISLGLSVPLFSGFSAQYRLLAAREVAAATVARAQQSELEVAQQVFSSYYQLRTGTLRVSTASELLTSATQSLEVAQGRYREGVGSILDLLTAQSALADARAQYVQARWTWYSTLAQLSRDVGVLGTRGETSLPLTAPAGGR